MNPGLAGLLASRCSAAEALIPSLRRRHRRPRVRQRFKVVVTKDGKTVGEIEEWRPADCVMGRVVALRAGPVAVGPRHGA